MEHTEKYDRIFQQIDTAIKGYVRSRHAPLATLRYIKRVVDAADDFRRAEVDAHDARNEMIDAETALIAAQEKNRVAQARVENTHNALEDILGGPI